jgi:HlyD family secretion protein
VKKKIIWIAVIVIILAGSVLGVTLIRKGKNGAVKYRVEAVGKGDIEAVVVTSGTLNPIDLVDVGSQVSGKIEKLNVDFNDTVKKGQIVAELDLEPLNLKIQQNEANYQSRVASLDRAKVAVDNYQKKYDRAKSLFEKKLLSIEELETVEVNYLSAKTDVISAQASLDQAKTQLDLSKVDLANAIIRSPVDGIVIARKVSPGQTIQASYQAPVLFQVATDLTKMKVECDVDEADIGKLKEGQKARFTVEAFPNDTFTGTVLQVRYASQTVQNVVTYTTVINVENPEKKLRPGMTATVSVVVGEAKNTLRVPNAALRFTPPQDVLEAAMKEMSDRMAAQRGPEGGPAGQPGAAAPQGGPSAQTQPQAQQMQQARGGQAGQGGFFTGARSGQGTSGARRQQPSRVWVQDKDGKIRMVFIRPGITDMSYTEVLKSEIKEGDEVITGLVGANPTAAQQMGGPGRGGPGGMMFIGR